MDIIFLYLGPILYLLSPASPSRLSTDLLADLSETSSSVRTATRHAHSHLFRREPSPTRRNLRNGIFNGISSHIPTMAYNPDALYSQPVGAPSTLPTVALTRMNEPGHAPQRDRCAAALQQLLQHLAGIPAGYNDHNLGHYGIAASNAEYLAKSNQRPHVPPANPGPGPMNQRTIHLYSMIKVSI